MKVKRIFQLSPNLLAFPEFYTANSYLIREHFVSSLSILQGDQEAAFQRNSFALIFKSSLVVRKKDRIKNEKATSR